ncbi:hypothetical protein O181_114459, partial [Austropuccinia psidii MF-1]|nr:hypothetical protein [Austropuccinia psidii MF-1]
MSASTRSKKAANDDAKPKPLSNDDMYSMLNFLRAEVMSLKSARSSNAAKMQSLWMAIYSPPPASSAEYKICVQAVHAGTIL